MNKNNNSEKSLKELLLKCNKVVNDKNFIIEINPWNNYTSGLLFNFIYIINLKFNNENNDQRHYYASYIINNNLDEIKYNLNKDIRLLIEIENTNYDIIAFYGKILQVINKLEKLLKEK